MLTHTLNVRQFYLTHRWDPIRCYHSKSEWTKEQWQWRGTQYSPKLQDWSLTIRLFSVISRTLVWGVLPLCIAAEGAVGIFGKCQACGLWPCTRTHQKKRPCATLSPSVGHRTNTADMQLMHFTVLTTTSWLGCHHNDCANAARQEEKARGTTQKKGLVPYFHVRWGVEQILQRCSWCILQSSLQLAD